VAFAPVALAISLLAGVAVVWSLFAERLNGYVDAMLAWYVRMFERAAIVVSPPQMRKRSLIALAIVLVAWLATVLMLNPSTLADCLLAVLYPGFVVVAVRLWIVRRVEKRLAEFSGQLEMVLRLVVSALRVGLGLRQAIGMVINEMPAPANVEFGRAFAQTAIGVTMEDALAALAERMPSTEMTMLSQTIRIQSKTGGNLTKILLNLAEMIKQRRRIERRVRALTAESRSTRLVITGLPIFVGTFIMVFEPDMRSALLGTMIGHVVLVLAIALLTAGWIVFGRLSRLDV